MAARTSHSGRSFLILHTVVVLTLITLVVLAIATADPLDGANIGAGLLDLILLVLGLPWSIPILCFPYGLDDAPKAAALLAHFAPAIINVLLHWRLVAGAGRRRRPEQTD
jgi:hypothetical protein